MKKPLEELSKRTLQRKLEQVNKENLTSEESELQLRILRRLYEIDREENPPRGQSLRGLLMALRLSEKGNT